MKGALLLTHVQVSLHAYANYLHLCENYVIVIYNSERTKMCPIKFTLWENCMQCSGLKTVNLIVLHQK
jgi:hypothetical protein